MEEFKIFKKIGNKLKKVESNINKINLDIKKITNKIDSSIKNTTNKVSSSIKKTTDKVSSNIKNTTNKVSSSIEKIIKKINWDKVGKLAYEGANMVVPIKTFEKISKGEKLNALDIINLASMVPIPGAGIAMKATKIAVTQVTKQVIKKINNKESNNKESNKTEIGKYINNKINTTKQIIKKSSYEPSILSKSIIVQKKKLDKIIQQSNKQNIKNISKNIDNVLKKDKTLNKDILKIIKKNMKFLKLKIPSEKILKQITDATIIATPIIIKSKEIYKYNKELNKKIKVIEKPKLIEIPKPKLIEIPKPKLIEISKSKLIKESKINNYDIYIKNFFYFIILLFIITNLNKFYICIKRI
jgi:hypothetical protein